MSAKVRQGTVVQENPLRFRCNLCPPSDGRVYARSSFYQHLQTVHATHCDSSSENTDASHSLSLLAMDRQGADEGSSYSQSSALPNPASMGEERSRHDHGPEEAPGGLAALSYMLQQSGLHGADRPGINSDSDSELDISGGMQVQCSSLQKVPIAS